MTARSRFDFADEHHAFIYLMARAKLICQSEGPISWAMSASGTERTSNRADPMSAHGRQPDQSASGPTGRLLTQNGHSRLKADRAPRPQNGDAPISRCRTAS